MTRRVRGDEVGGLLFRAHRRARAAANGALREDGIELQHLGVLAHLADRGTRRQHEVGESLGLDKSTLGRLIAELEGLGLVERRRSPQDGRAHDVSITTIGTYRLASCRRHTDAAVAELLTGLDPAEQETLCVLLRRITDPTPDP